jgi:hypothetical protein
MCVFSLTNDDVIERTLRTRASGRRLIEGRPGASEGARARVVRLQARHGGSEGWRAEVGTFYDMYYVKKRLLPPPRLTSGRGAPARWARRGGRAARRKPTHGRPLHRSRRLPRPGSAPSCGTGLARRRRLIVGTRYAPGPTGPSTEGAPKQWSFSPRHIVVGGEIWEGRVAAGGHTVAAHVVGQARPRRR